MGWFERGRCMSAITPGHSWQGDRFQSRRPTGAGADSAAAVSPPGTRTARCFPGGPMAREIGLRPPAGFPQRFVGRPGRVGDLAVGERDLAFSGAVELGQHLLAAVTPTPDRGDLPGQVLDPGAGGAGFSCISVVEPLQVVVELGVGKTDELLQGRSRKVTVLVVDSLDPGAVNSEQLLAEQVQLAAQQHELAEHRTEGLVIDAAEIRYGLEVGP